MIKKGLIYFFLLVQYSLFSQIPDERIVNWSVAGLIDSIAEPNLVIDVTDYGLVGDSITDNSYAFLTAIATLGKSKGVLFFPQGKYLFTNQIQIPAGVIIRGEGSDKTRFYFNLGEDPVHCILVSAAQYGDFTRVYSGFEKGSDTLVLRSNISLNEGDFLEIRQENGDWDSNPAIWAKDVVGQILKVAQQKEDSLFLVNPLRLDFDTTLNLKVRKINPITNVAIECLYVERLDEPISSGSNIFLSYAANCRVKGVESNVSSGSHIFITYSTNILVEGSYIHHSFNYDGTGTNGYGMTIDNYSGECLIRDNIFRFLRHAMMVKAGANGNVFAYNYSIEPNRSEFGSTLSGDISLHGHYAFSNLFEGNIVQNIVIDHFWGPSGPYNTFFRNRVELFGILFYNDGSILTNRQNIVGNEISNINYPFGQYSLSGTDHFEYGNNDGGVNIPVSTSDITTTSYYLTSTPEFWEHDLIWPSVGYPNLLDEYKIPAQLRYENDTIFTTCMSNPSIDDEIIDTTHPEKLVLSPNPFKEFLNVDFEVEEPTDVFIEIWDLAGIRKFSKTFSNFNGNIQLTNDIEMLPPGSYFFILKSGYYEFRRTIIKN